MKKLLLLILLIPTSVFSQKIELDKIENGARYILGSYESVRSFTDKYPISVNVSAVETNDDEPRVLLSLGLKIVSNYPISVSANSILLIKTENDDTIELRSTTSQSDKIGQYIPAAKTRNYTVLLHYAVTSEQLSQISKGVKKIRIETSLDPINKEFKKDKIGSIVDKEYSLIKEALSKKKKFSDGF